MDDFETQQQIKQQVTMRVARIAYHALDWGFANLTPEQALEGARNVISLATEQMAEENLAPILKAIVERTDPNVILTVLERAGYAERHHAMAYLLAGTAGIIYYEPDQYNEMVAPLLARCFIEDPKLVLTEREERVMACLLWLTDFQGFSMIDKLPDMPSGWEEEPVLPLQARITRGITRIAQGRNGLPSTMEDLLEFEDSVRTLGFPTFFLSVCSSGSENIQPYAASFSDIRADFESKQCRWGHVDFMIQHGVLEKDPVAGGLLLAMLCCSTPFDMALIAAREWLRYALKWAGPENEFLCNPPQAYEVEVAQYVLMHSLWEDIQHGR